MKYYTQTYYVRSSSIFHAYSPFAAAITRNADIEERMVNQKRTKTNIKPN